MAIIKRAHVVEKGFVDLRQEDLGTITKAREAVQQPQTYQPSYTTEPKEFIPNVSFDDAQQKADEIISAAREEAEGIISQAQSEAEELRSQARQEGVDEGKEEGRQQVADNIEQSFTTLNEAVKERKKIIKDAESELTRLSLKIAEQIIKSEVSLNKDVVLNIVAEAISRVSDRESIIIKVNHDDAEQVKQHRDKITGLVDGIKNLTILEDSLIEPGGCIVETSLGYVDARISTKLSLMEQAFKKVESSDSQ